MGLPVLAAALPHAVVAVRATGRVHRNCAFSVHMLFVYILFSFIRVLFGFSHFFIQASPECVCVCVTPHNRRPRCASCMQLAKMSLLQAPSQRSMLLPSTANQLPVGCKCSKGVILVVNGIVDRGQ